MKLLSKIFTTNGTITAPTNTAYIFARVTGKGGNGTGGGNYGTLAVPVNLGGPGGGGGAYTMHCTTASTGEVFSAAGFGTSSSQIQLLRNGSFAASAASGGNGTNQFNSSDQTIAGTGGSPGIAYSASIDGDAYRACQDNGVLSTLEARGVTHANGAMGHSASDQGFGGGGGGCGNPAGPGQIGGTPNYWDGGTLGGGVGGIYSGVAPYFTFFDGTAGLIGGGGGGGYYGGAAGFGGPGQVEITFLGEFTTLSAPLVLAYVLNKGTTMEGLASRVVSVSAIFNQQVTLASGAMSLALHTTAVTYDDIAAQAGIGFLPGSSTLTSSSNNTVWTLTFSGANLETTSLKDGVYKLTVDHTKVTAVSDGETTMVADSTYVFARFFGAYYGCVTVSTTMCIVVDDRDKTWFSRTFNSAANYARYYDYDDSGLVSALDNLQFRIRFGHKLTWQ